MTQFWITKILSVTGCLLHVLIIDPQSSIRSWIITEIGFRYIGSKAISETKILNSNWTWVTAVNSAHENKGNFCWERCMIVQKIGSLKPDAIFVIFFSAISRMTMDRLPIEQSGSRWSYHMIEKNNSYTMRALIYLESLSSGDLD